MIHEEIAENLLFPLWRCIDEDFKNKYKGDAWSIFENFLKTSACNENLKQFFEKLKRLMPMNWQHQYEKQILSVLQSGKDDQILNDLRTECAYLVLLTRAMNNERKQNLKEKYEDINP